MYQITQQLYQNIYHLTGILTLITHFLCAFGVSKDLGKLASKKIEPKIMPGVSWILVTLITGVWGIAVYWLVNHTNFSRN